MLLEDLDKMHVRELDLSRLTEIRAIYQEEGIYVFVINHHKYIIQHGYDGFYCVKEENQLFPDLILRFDTPDEDRQELIENLLWNIEAHRSESENRKIL